MLNKQEMKNATVDFEMLAELESHLSLTTKKYLKGTFKTATNRIIDFDINYSSVLAKSMANNNGYTVLIGRNLTKSLLSFCNYVAKDLHKHLNWSGNEDITYFLFYYIYWFILNHELSHIIFGHLDYIKTNGVVRLTPEGKKTLRLHSNDEINTRYWHALESEADGNAMPICLQTFFVINTSEHWKNLTHLDVIKIHGVLATLVYTFMDVLSGDEPDMTHPEPYIRQNLTLPCLDVLARQIGVNTEEYTKTVIESHLHFSAMFLKKCPSNDEILKSFYWMKSLDSILKEMKTHKKRTTIKQP